VKLRELSDRLAEVQDKDFTAKQLKQEIDLALKNAQGSKGLLAAFDSLPSSTIHSQTVGVARVLVVDDEVNLRKVLAAMLRKEGYEVAVAADGEQAIADIEKNGATSSSPIS